MTSSAGAGIARHGQDHSPLPQAPSVPGVMPNTPAGGLRWTMPPVVFLVAFLLQNAGLSLTTAKYVAWMEELDSQRVYWVSGAGSTGSGATATPMREMPADGSGGVARPKLALADFGVEAFGGHALDSMWLELFTAAVPLAWLGFVARTRNLRLWTHAFFAGVLCSGLKGLFALTTVSPDVGGWEACASRLGEGGVDYYRQVAAGKVNLVAIVVDDLFLTFRGLWSIGAPERTRYCADNLFCVPICFCALASMALYDCVRSFALTLDGVQRRATICGVAGSLLGLVVLSNMALAIVNSYHYTVDVVVACLLALTVYNNPAVALVAQSWAVPRGAQAFQAWPLVDALIPRSSSTDSISGGSPLVVDDEHGPGGDLGLVGVPPCCLPFCALSGFYYLRGQPNHNAALSWHSGEVGSVPQAVQKRRSRLAQLGQVSQDVARRQQHLEATLEEMTVACARQDAEAADATDKQIAERTQEAKHRLESEGVQALEQSKKSLAMKKCANVQFKDGINATKLRVARLETGFGETGGSAATADRMRLLMDAQAEAEAVRALLEKQLASFRARGEAT